MGVIKLLIVGGLLARAVYTDWKENRVENQLMAFGMIMGLFISMYYRGIKGLMESGAMVVITFIALSILFAIKGLGAGDIKLLCVLAAFYKKDIFWIAAVSFLVAGIICVYKMGMRGIQRKEIYIPYETIAFTLPIAIGTLIVTCYRYMSVFW